MGDWRGGDSGLFSGHLTTLIAVIVLLILYFKRLSPVVLVLLPIGLTILYTLAIAEWLGLTLNMANILVVPLIIGLGVDTAFISFIDTSNLGPAMLWTPLIKRSFWRTDHLWHLFLCPGPHGGAASIGLLLTIAIGLLLAISLTVLPCSADVFATHTPKERSSPDVACIEPWASCHSLIGLMAFAPPAIALIVGAGYVLVSAEKELTFNVSATSKWCLQTAIVLLGFNIAIAEVAKTGSLFRGRRSVHRYCGPARRCAGKTILY